MTSGPPDSGAQGTGPAETTGTSPEASATPAVPDDPDELRREIERTREQLGETVEQLASKADVKKQAQDKAAELRTQAKARASQLAGRSRRAARQAQQVAARGASSARQHAVPLAVATASASMLLAGYLLIRSRRPARRS